MATLPNPTYCPVCGDNLIEREFGDRLRATCQSCGYIHYTNPVPGVGLIIEVQDKIVLVQRGGKVHTGRWALPSGFIESDESVEEAAIREAREETGLDVELMEVLGVYSFPEGPPASGIIIFYRARPLRGELKAGDDANAVRLLAPEDVPRLPFRTHRQVMSRYLRMVEERKSPEEDPITFKIRRAEVVDSDAIVDLLRKNMNPAEATDTDWRSVAQRFRESASLQLFVAESTQPPYEIIGFVALSLVRTLTGAKGWIDDMVFKPQFANEQVGVALLEAAMRHGRRLNLTHLYVNISRGNANARDFYQIVGFRPSSINYLRIR